MWRKRAALVGVVLLVLAAVFAQVSHGARKDRTPPTTPTSLAVSNATETGAVLTWAQSTDNVAVSAYDIYRNGALVASVGGSTTSYTYSGLTCGTNYTLGVVARDAAGNSSAQATTQASTSACVQSPAYPVSFFTGPLGANNILPTKTGAFLIDWYDGDSVPTAQKQAGIQKRQNDTGRIMDGVGFHPDWSGAGCTARIQAETDYLNWIIGQGSFPVLSWTPQFTIGQMNTGAADSCWVNTANFLKSFAPTRIMLRPFWEFDGDWFIWSAVAGSANGNVNYCGTPFINAWRRMVGIFQQQGASNVGFFYNPGEGGYDRSCSVNSYPGDAYVDWVGTETYNFCMVGDNTCFGTPVGSGWRDFWELNNYNSSSGSCISSGEPVPPLPGCTSQYAKFSGVSTGIYSTKPFVIGECGTRYDPAVPTKKGTWYTNIVPALKGNIGPNGMPHLIGIEFFDADVSSTEDPRNNWRVDFPTTEPSAYNGWKTMAQDPYFNTR